MGYDFLQALAIAFEVEFGESGEDNSRKSRKRTSFYGNHHI